jgi:hypothetical protein
MVNILKVDFKAHKLVKVIERKNQPDYDYLEEKFVQRIAELFDEMKELLSENDYVRVLEAISSSAHYKQLARQTSQLLMWCEEYFKII